MTRSPAAAAAPLARSGHGPQRLAAATNALNCAAVAHAAPGGRSLSPVPVASTLAAAPLPLPALVGVVPRSPVHYVVSAIDDRGRLGDTSSVGILGWQPGLAVAFMVLPAGVGVVVVRGGPATLTGLGRIHLPVAVRRALHLEPGDRLLLAAHVGQDQIVAYTTAALDMMTAQMNRCVGPA